MASRMTSRLSEGGQAAYQEGEPAWDLAEGS